MAILVDEARWPWRGTHWCHLVSDTSLGELHEFAGRLGCRRVGFQGDHYDIDVVTRNVAIELGAEQCASRELVRRLRAAGLRLRPSSFDKWRLVGRWEPFTDSTEIIRTTAPLRPDAHTILEQLAGPSNDGAFALERNGSVAAVVFGTGTAPPFGEAPDAGRHVRIDHAERWSVELVEPPLRDIE